MLNRYEAADIRKFTDACACAFAFGPQDGYIYYSIEVDLIGPDGAPRKEAAVAHFHTKLYSEEERAKVITQLWIALVQEGLIGDTGNPAKPLSGAITLTGNPINDIIQVADARAKGNVH